MEYIPCKFRFLKIIQANLHRNCIYADNLRKFIFGKNEHKTTFFYITGFLYDLSCLRHCKQLWILTITVNFNGFLYFKDEGKL